MVCRAAERRSSIALGGRGELRAVDDDVAAALPARRRGRGAARACHVSDHQRLAHAAVATALVLLRGRDDRREVRLDEYLGGRRIIGRKPFSSVTEQ